MRDVVADHRVPTGFRESRWHRGVGLDACHPQTGDPLLCVAGDTDAIRVFDVKTKRLIKVRQCLRV